MAVLPVDGSKLSYGFSSVVIRSIGKCVHLCLEGEFLSGSEVTRHVGWRSLLPLAVSAFRPGADAFRDQA